LARSFFIFMLLEHGQGVGKSGDYVKVRVRRKEDFHFINIDLELESSESVQPLVKELDEQTCALYCSDIDEMANLELHIFERNGVDFYKSYDENNDLVGAVDVHINEFCNLVEKLSSESRRIWNNCYRKEFDIGFQVGNTQKTYKTQIQLETIKRCAELGATIMITAYPHCNYEMRHKKDLKKKK